MIASSDRRSRWIRLAFPLLLGALYAYFHFIQPLPVEATDHYDPEMGYLFNSLAFFKSRPYTYYHHPGTPVMLVGTLILLVMKLASGLSSEALVLQAMAEPERFLMIAHGAMTLLAAVTLYLALGVLEPADSKPNRLLSVGVGVSFFATLPGVSLRLTHGWNHNLFSFPAGTLLFLLLWIRLRRQPRLTTLEVVTWGAAAGVLWAVQFYFSAWVAAVVAALAVYQYLRTSSVLQGLAGGVAAAFGGGAGYGLAFLPLLHRMREYLWWMKGQLATGGRGWLVPSTLWGAFRSLWSGHEILFLSLIGSLILLALAVGEMRQSGRGQVGWWSMAVGVVLALGLASSAAMTAAIAQRPSKFYLMPLAAMIPILLALSFTALQGRRGRMKLILRGVSALLVVGFVFSLIASVRGYGAEARQFQQESQWIESVMTREFGPAIEDGSQPVTLWAYGSPSRCYALHFGNLNTEYAFNREMGRLCPTDWAYDAWSDEVAAAGQVFPLEGADSWDLLIGPEKYLPPGYPQLGRVEPQPGSNLIAVIR